MRFTVSFNVSKSRLTRAVPVFICINHTLNLLTIDTLPALLLITNHMKPIA